MSEEARAREVLAEDREAAAELFGGTPWSRAQFLSGKRDRTDKVQAFALHRERAMLAYAKPADREAIARAICEGFGDDPEREGPFADWFEGAFGDAVDRILSLPHPKQGEMT